MFLSPRSFSSTYEGTHVRKSPHRCLQQIYIDDGDAEPWCQRTDPCKESKHALGHEQHGRSNEGAVERMRTKVAWSMVRVIVSDIHWRRSVFVTTIVYGSSIFEVNNTHACQ